MPDTFNGYHVWLGIPLSEQPPHHYRLLGIAAFESDLDVIDHAADRQMAHVRTFQSGKHQALSQQILNELAAARLCLLNAPKKSAYDEQLRAKLGAVPKAAAVVVGKAVPIAQAVASATIPAAKPAAKTAPKPAPQRTPAATAAKPKVATADDDMIGMDFAPAAGVTTTLSSTISLRGRRRTTRRASSWQRPALMGILAAVAVTGAILFYFFVKWVAQRDWSDIDPSILEPRMPASAPADVRGESTDLPAPQPAPPAASADQETAAPAP